MNDTIQALKNTLLDLVNQIVTMSPELLVIVAILIVGFVLKLVKSFPNEYIPAVGSLMGASLYPFVADVAKVDYQVRLPWLRQILIGLALWLVAWVLHEKVLKRFNKYLPKGFSAGDTEFAEKPATDEKGKP